MRVERLQRDQRIRIHWVVGGYPQLCISLMPHWIGIRQSWLQKVTPKPMGSIMRRLLLQWQKWIQSGLFSHWQRTLVGRCINLMLKMSSCMEAWRKKYTWRFHLVMVLLMKGIRCGDLRRPCMVLNNHLVPSLEGLLKLWYLWGSGKLRMIKLTLLLV